MTSKFNVSIIYVKLRTFWTPLVLIEHDHEFFSLINWFDSPWRKRTWYCTDSRQASHSRWYYSFYRIRRRFQKTRVLALVIKQENTSRMYSRKVIGIAGKIHAPSQHMMCIIFQRTWHTWTSWQQSEQNGQLKIIWFSVCSDTENSISEIRLPINRCHRVLLRPHSTRRTSWQLLAEVANLVT